MTGHCLPHRHHQLDFFVADIIDAAHKADIASMEHPLFALKAGDRRVRTYTRNSLTVTIKPGNDGCATIFDKDFWIFGTSQLIEAINRGRTDTRSVIRFTAHEFLLATNRSTTGVGYQRMIKALGRLAGTRIETNIATHGQRERAGFGLIDSWRVIECDHNNRMVAVEICFPDWLWRSIKARQVLTLHPDYFRLRKPLERRIYELARKHCGKQPKWHINLINLHEKSGSTASLREFRRQIRALADSNILPEYRVVFDTDADQVVFHNQNRKIVQEKINVLMDKTKKTIPRPKRVPETSE
uniref:Putative replication protein n=1 Tax=mine drainage metagenome TaxID=410659 RepID=E6QX48_9ZZZZ